jgi:predicted amidohydrolase
MKDIRIAVAVADSEMGRPLKNLERMIPFVRAAKQKGAKIICFPEMNISGYSSEKIAGKMAQTIPGPISQHLLEMAQNEGMVILAGLAEKDAAGRLFASHLVAKPDGMAGVYRKIQIAPPERAVFSAGRKIPLFKTDGLTFGIQLCYDAHFPELSTKMAEKGADLIFIPHASPRGTEEEKRNSWMRHLPARAFDNSVFIVAFNQTGEYKKGVRFPGVAIIIGPSGNVIKEYTGGHERLIVVDLKESELSAVRNSPMRYFLPNRKTL